MPGTYQYEPGNIAEYGKDRMRFELGDVMVEGKEKTCALCDEEYNAVLPEKIPTTRQWKKAKLRCLESIMRKFAFEPDTKVGPLSLSMGERAKLWKEMYEDLKKDLKELCDFFDHSLIYEKGSLRTETVTALLNESFHLEEVLFLPTAENFAYYFYKKFYL